MIPRNLVVCRGIGLSCTNVDISGQHRDRLRLIGFCSGVQIKTRKRNIAVALDPGSFADAVVTIFEDQKDGDDLEKNLLAGVKVFQLFTIALAINVHNASEMQLLLVACTSLSEPVHVPVRCRRPGKGMCACKIAQKCKLYFQGMPEPLHHDWVVMCAMSCRSLRLQRSTFRDTGTHSLRSSLPEAVWQLVAMLWKRGRSLTQM